MVKQLVRDNQRKDLRYEAQQQQLSHLSNELATAKNELARVRAREAMMADLVHATTPTDRRSTLGRNVRPRLEHDSQLFPAGHDGGPGEMLSLTRMCTTTAKGSPQKYDAGTPQSAAAQGASDVCSQNEGQSTPQNPQPVARPLMFGAEAREISEKPCTIKGQSISQLLISMYKENSLVRLKWKQAKIPDNYTEKSLARNSIELCQFVMSEEEIEKMKTGGLPDEELMQLATVIGNRAFTKLWELEGLDPNIEAQLNAKKKGGQQKKPTYGAVGRRVGDYKKILAEKSGKKVKEVELQERPPQQDAAGTPEGNKSILSFTRKSRQSK